MTGSYNGIARAPNGDIEIAYETFGSLDDRPLLLIPGNAVQMLFWPGDFCAGLAERGFGVARFDYRDIGLSTHIPAPRRFTRGYRPFRPLYRLDDLISDAVAVLDAIGWAAAHVVGASMGGIVAQAMAARRPDRVLTLTCIAATPTGRVGRASIRTLLRAAASGFRAGKGRDGAGQAAVNLFRVISSPAHPLDEDWVRDTALRAYDRSSNDGRAIRRQAAAIGPRFDLRPELENLSVPTLVLHGEDDPMTRVAGGRAIAAVIPGARLVTYPGVGHWPPNELWPAIIDEIDTLTT